MGPQLMDDLRKQAERFGAELVTDDVTEMDLTADPKVVKVGETTYLAKTVVLAMGSAYRNLGVPGESELSGRGVSWCATCDGFFFRDQDIVVVGGGGGDVPDPLRPQCDDGAPAGQPARQQDHAGAGVQQRRDPFRLAWTAMPGLLLSGSTGSDREAPAEGQLPGLAGRQLEPPNPPNSRAAAMRSPSA
jgi:glycine/D-amino acid oxidase-like deaminating enzyme